MRRRTAMDKIEIHRLLEQLLNESDSAREDRIIVDRAALLRALTEAKATGKADSAALDKLAAYLDGAFDADEHETFSAEIAGSPAELHELESADAFLAAVSSEATAVPEELVAEAARVAQRENIKSLPKRGGFLNSASWGRQLAWGGGAAAALAATVLIAIAVSSRDSGLYFALPRGSSVPVRAGDQPLALPPQILSIPPEQQAATTSTKNELRPTSRVTPVPSAPDPLLKLQQFADGSRDRKDTSVLARSPEGAAAAITPAPPPPPPAAAPALQSETVMVTGSLIRGTAAVSVPVTNLAQAQDKLSAYPGQQAQNTER